MLLCGGVIGLRKSPASKIYNDSKVSFRYKGTFSLGQIDYDKIRIAEITNNDNKMAEIATIETDDAEKSLKTILVDSYPDLNKNNLRKIIKPSSEAYQFVQSDTDETATYTYIKKGRLVLMAKFYNSYYPLNNPLVKIDNSMLLKDYLNIVNSLELK